jgi:hypothetical protein
MRFIVISLLISAAVGCSKYEFQDPTGVKATVVYDRTGTADQVSAQITSEVNIKAK